MDILKAIVIQKQKELDYLTRYIKKKDLISACGRPRKILDFKKSISKAAKLNIIGEIKRSSPSAGLLRKKFEPVKIASVYKKNGISAISVLTDEKFFGGSLDYIELVKKRVNLPVLRKDFIIDEYQIYESYLAEADAVLLIAAILGEKKLERFIKLTEKLKLTALVEVHDKKELFKALNCNARVIGINNRNLKTFEVDLCTTEKLFAFIPKGKIVVSESGLRSAKDLLRLKEIGVDAVLIGETFMKASNIDQKVKKILKGLNYSYV